jgi:formate dehydrogenase major subunit
MIYSREPEDRYYVQVNIPCQHGCPVNTNIPAYIRAIYEDQYNRSYDINVAVNIFPGILGRICSRPCEDLCRHGEAELGDSVGICHLKRVAADFRSTDASVIPPRALSVGKSVAVVGAGPAGLAAAHDLATVGFSVTVYEAFEKPGGMLEYGIPEFRLPRDILSAEIDYVLSLGVTLKTGIRVGTDVAVEELLSRFDAVVIAAGCLAANRLDVPGEALPGTFAGLDFMIDACSGKPPSVGKRVLVIGAGFTAFDCARSALRLGADDVTICLRRTEEDLTVTGEEVLEAKREGVRINSLMISRRIIGTDRVEGVEFVRAKPGELRPDGKRSVTPIEGSEFVVSADTVIVATGQNAVPIDSPGETDRYGVVKADRGSFRSSVKGLYVTGDYLTGPTTVIEAIAGGRRAAEVVARDLLGRKFREQVVRIEETSITDRKRTWDFVPRQSMPTVRSMSDRFESATREVETGYSPELGAEEAKRCYLCYLHYEIDVNRCIYCRYCIDVAPRDCIKMVKEVVTNDDGAVVNLVETTDWCDVHAIVIDNERCIRCGECVRVCPVDCISVSKVELTERLVSKE